MLACGHGRTERGREGGPGAIVQLASPRIERTNAQKAKSGKGGGFGGQWQVPRNGPSRRRRRRFIESESLSLTPSLACCSVGRSSVDIWDARKKQLAGAKWLTAFHVGAILLSFGGKSGTCLRRERREEESASTRGPPKEQLDSKRLYCFSFLLGGPIPSHLILLLSGPPSSIYRLSY